MAGIFKNFGEVLPSSFGEAQSCWKLCYIFNIFNSQLFKSISQYLPLAFVFKELLPSTYINVT